MSRFEEAGLLMSTASASSLVSSYLRAGGYGNNSSLRTVCIIAIKATRVHCATIASAIFSAVIKVGKLVLAHGTTGNSEASTTRSPPTPRTRP
jgi:hypothetical protein